MIISSYFYTAMLLIRKKMADNMKKQGGFIPGIRPGTQQNRR
jgi:preprotein translocase subunit SecY